ncbi:MAG TPA: carbohydrate-binding protein [Phycisphaerales bacterium]|nr:carbohydrate-binding protein [Phycisphaerales bacterium]
MTYFCSGRFIAAVLTVFLFGRISFSQNIVINEFMASNGSTVADDDGDFPDWIELYNAGSEPVNLGGWGLSDDPERPYRWIFSDVVIDPEGHLLVWASGKDRYYGSTTREEVIVTAGSEWKYLDDGSDQGTAWRDPAFDDSAWSSGPAPLGYPAWRDDAQYAATVVSYGNDSNNKHITTYFRRHFSVSDMGPAASLLLSLWIDDGAVVYLNGTEIVRENMPDGQITYLTTTPTFVAQWPSWTHYEVSADALVPGENVLAVEVHQTSSTSSDIAFDLRLLANVYESNPHTNFSISADGEPLILTRPDGTTADDVPPTVAPRDISYGRASDGGDVWGFFTEPTPAASNSASQWYMEVLSEPTFSHQGGFYTEPFELAMSYDDPEVTIYYTLDGSEPDPANLNGNTYRYKNRYPQSTGDTSLGPFLYRQRRTYQYTSPLTITDRSPQAYQLATINTEFSYSTRLPQSNIFKGTVVRARAYKDNAIPGRSATHTYFVNPDIKARYALPVISVVTDEANFFDYDKGIYVAGAVGDQWRLSNPSAGWNAGQPANYHMRGYEWERPAHFEMFDADGTPLLSQNIGARIHGGWSRGWFPKSIRLYARSEYDDDNAFEFPFFDGLEKRGQPGEPLTTFRRLILRNSGNDFDRTYFRDALMHHLVRHLPIDTMAYRPAVHFINGEYWGMINIRERYDNEYIEGHYGVDPDDVVILTYGHAQVDTGFPSDRDHFIDTVSYALTNDPAQAAHYNWLQQRVDTDNLALYYAIQVYYNNTDWPHNNIDWWRKRTETYEPTAPYGHDGRWRWLLYDTDFGMGLYGNYAENSLSRVMSSTDRGWTNTLFNRLRRNTQFRNTFINAMADLMNTSFKPAHVHALIDAYNARLLSSRPEHNNRWSVSISSGGEMKTFASQRPGYMRSFLLGGFGLSGTRTVTVSRNADWGHVQVNSIVIDTDTPGLNSPSAPYPWTGEYYRDVPVTVRAVPRQGYRFSHWLNAPAGSDPFSDTLTLPMTSNVSMTAVFESAALMHYWSFNDAAALLSPRYTLGGAAATVAIGSTAEVVSGTGQDFNGENNRLGEPVGSHLRINNPLDAALTLNLPTTGYEQIVLMVETRRSGQGAGEQTLSYSIDGQTFVPFETYAVYDDDPVLRTFDFTETAGVDNNPQFAVRITFAQADGGTAGNNRFDNITLEGTPMPGTNQPPKLIAHMPDRVLIEEASGSMDLAGYFADPDDDALTFDVQTNKPQVAEATVSGSLLDVTAMYRGDMIITIIADDGHNPPLEIGFKLLVYPKAHPLSEGNFSFGQWSPDQPEHTFPEHMLFLQSNTSDPGLETPLEYAYFIPHDGDDGYHEDDQDIIGFPYMATGRSRLNGLDQDGISFINTGRERDLGGALLALDTRSVEAVELSWLCETIWRYERQYAIRLQYRIGHTGDFVDLMEGGHPVEYMAMEDGHIQPFDSIRLPDKAVGKPYVQLLWRYYHADGDSGKRSQLRLDDIVVTLPTFPYDGQPHSLPGRIQAERFDVGGQGVSYYDTTEGNSGGGFRSDTDVDIISATDGFVGYAISDIEDGEWLLYTVHSAAAQTDVYARVASSQAGGQIRVWLDNELLATLDVPHTGSLTTWQTISSPCQPLPDREDAVLKVEFIGSHFRLNWIDFQNRRPYLGVPAAIPGRIDFKNYDIGGQQISYLDRTNANGYGQYRPDESVDIMGINDGGQPGFGVYAEIGEWLEYTCSIQPGLYTVIVRSSSAFSTQRLTLSQNGQTVAEMALPNTGSWSSWQSTAVSNVYLAGGENQVLRFSLNTSTALLSYVEFIRDSNPADINQSGYVDVADFAVLAAQWLGAPGVPSADIAPPGGDGVVDLLDLLFLAENWLTE